MKTFDIRTISIFNLKRIEFWRWRWHIPAFSHFIVEYIRLVRNSNSVRQWIFRLLKLLPGGKREHEQRIEWKPSQAVSNRICQFSMLHLVLKTIDFHSNALLICFRFVCWCAIWMQIALTENVSLWNNVCHQTEEKWAPWSGKMCNNLRFRSRIHTVRTIWYITVNIFLLTCHTDWHANTLSYDIRRRVL